MLKSRSRLRLVVVQVMVLALFATLFARLWYIQVVGGDGYQAAAQENTVRDIELAGAARADRRLAGPAAGRQPHVVGRHRRPRRARQARRHDQATRCWPGSPTPSGCRRTSSYGVPRPAARTAPPSRRCAGTARRTSRVPVAEDVSQSLAASILEQSEDFPGISAESRKVRAYPSPFGINAAHVLGYNSPITEAELDAAEEAGDARSARCRSSVGPGSRTSYNRYLSGTPGVREVSVDSMGRVISEGADARPSPATPSSPASTPRCSRSSSSSSSRRS